MFWWHFTFFKSCLKKWELFRDFEMINFCTNLLCTSQYLVKISQKKFCIIFRSSGRKLNSKSLYQKHMHYRNKWKKIKRNHFSRWSAMSSNKKVSGSMTTSIWKYICTGIFRFPRVHCPHNPCNHHCYQFFDRLSVTWTSNKWKWHQKLLSKIIHIRASTNQTPIATVAFGLCHWIE